ncbi:MAG: hypothetical protein IPK59_03255 [Rhodospirillaceae bacterium]|jgi:hypothetical protein|nr:hypothetical protein [Rhodospirillaceae bacterium]
MMKILLPVLGALALTACAVEPQYELHQQVSGLCGSAETAMATLAGAKTATAAEVYKNSPTIAVDGEVAALLGGDYPDLAEAGGSAPTNDYWRHVELRWNDYDAACIGARAPNP